MYWIGFMSGFVVFPLLVTLIVIAGNLFSKNLGLKCNIWHSGCWLDWNPGEHFNVTVHLAGYWHRFVTQRRAWHKRATADFKKYGRRDLEEFQP